MRLLKSFQLALSLAASGMVFADAVAQQNSPVSGATTNPATPPTFAQVVRQYFTQWDSNGDGKLTPDEINAAVTNPAFHDEAAAALAAIKLVVRGGKYTLPDITEGYLVASPLREPATAKVQTDSPDEPAQPKVTDHPPAFQPRYRSALSRLHRVARELFPQAKPVLDNCHQGPLGDCYFVSVVGGMVDRNPATVKSLFTQKNDGSTTVAFGNGHRVKVPPLTDAEIAISSTAGTNGLWLTVLENAFGKFREAAQPGNPQDDPDTDIIAHGGKPGYVINTLDGFKTKSYALQLGKGQHHAAQFPTNLMDDLSAALQHHRLAEATTATNSLPPGINGKHAYAILAYNRDRGLLRLWNPHGNNFKPKGPDGPQYGYTTKAGQFDMPLKDLLVVYKSVIIETSTPTEP